jgi:sigma-B regulation protein RsbU (phosphoserine phosphatase)
MIRAVIVEDEAPARERLRRLLNGRVDVVGEAADGDEAIQRIDALGPDLVFLDIQMPGCSGLEVAARLRAPKPRIVFCTAYDEFALAAFEQQAIDYLLKPVNQERLGRTVDRVTRELRDIDDAVRTQARLMPQGSVTVGGLECYGQCRPARDIGGDYFDFLPIDAERIGLAVGDVSGKGEFAALLAAAIQARMQTLVAGGVIEPDDLIARLNRLTVDTIEESRFATVFFARYDSTARALHYVNAGHPPAFILSRDGSVSELGTTALAIGWAADATIRQRTVVASPGDLILIYSDGVSETLDPAGRELEPRALARFAAAHSEECPADAVRRVFDEIDRYAGYAPAADDRTLVVAKVG